MNEKDGKKRLQANVLDRIYGWPVINEDMKSVKDTKEDSPFSPRKHMLIDLKSS
jgi:hypothetical protein